MENSKNTFDENPRDNLKKKTISGGLCSLCREYCSKSSIHGISYIGEKDRPLIEKIFWIFICVLSVCICITQIYDSYVKWDEAPVIVSFSEKSTPVWDLPFPAVTICPEAKAQKTIFNFTQVYHKIYKYMSKNSTDVETEVPYNLTNKEFEYLLAMGEICDTHVFGGLSLDSNITVNIVETIEHIALDLESCFFSCFWMADQEEIETCSTYFRKTITDEGVCFTFNGLDNKFLIRNRSEEDNHDYPDWKLGTGYRDNLDLNTFPRRVVSSGIKSSMIIILQGNEKDADYICRGPITGYKVILHSPDEVPLLESQFVRVPFNKEVAITVQPNLMTTSESLRNYSPQRRQCYFNEERYLKYFKIYTESSCEIECLANFTLLKCGCVRFSMPDFNDPICNLTMKKCCEVAEQELLKLQFKHSKQNQMRACNCLPACTSLSYGFEISQAELDVDKLLHAFSFEEELVLQEGEVILLSRLIISFKENKFLTSKRSELYGITAFLSSCGGLLGLFMGVSALSVVEVLYFCTFRLRLRKRYKQV